ncbi:MAG: PTS sugar transporter subunit IIA [Sedimentisphaerales bacterium]|nr:PTS sugar transporter subunit IIA [Sedimentisphaerales bacterium]
MRLADILDIKCVKVPLKALEKNQAITELIDLLDRAGLLDDYDIAFKAVMQRESVRSTGVGQGFAIPHGKSSAVDNLVMAVGRTSAPIDFESIDKKPVDIIFLLISPLDQTGPHIQALAGISRLMTDLPTRSRIDECSTAEQFYKLVTEFDK